MSLAARNTLPDWIQEQLALLNEFRNDAWGNDSIFKEQQIRQSGPNTRVVEYLNLGNHFDTVRLFCRHIKDPMLLVVQEYCDAMNVFKSEDPNYKQGACIIGQPGIGKTYFLVYAVIERLRERKPVAVHVHWMPDAYILFSENSVEFYDDARTGHLERHTPVIWAFSDSDDTSEIPPMAFRAALRIRVFQTTSPEFDRWKDWSKYSQVNLYIMDLWSDDEIEDLAFIFHPDKTELIKDLARKWGNVPRTLRVSVFSSTYREWYEDTLNAAVTTAANMPETVIRAILGLDNRLDYGPSAVFFVKPVKENNVIRRSGVLVSIPTSWIVDLLVAALNLLQAARKVEFFYTLAVYPGTSAAAGRVLGAVVHDFLMRGKSITIHWYDEPSPQVLELPPLDLRTMVKDLDSPLPFYWFPDSPNYPGIDGAVVTKDHVYVIQTTIGCQHSSPQIGVDQLWAAMPQDKKALKWKLLFIGLVENQAKEVAARYARCLQVGDVQTREKAQPGAWIPRGDLPVGRVSLFPDVPDPMSSWARVEAE